MSVLLTDSAQIWEWDEVSWAGFVPTTPARVGAGPAFVYDEFAAACVYVVTDYFVGTGTLYQNQYLWNGVAWREVTPAVMPRFPDSPRVCFDSLRGVIVAHLQDTWEYR